MATFIHMTGGLLIAGAISAASKLSIHKEPDKQIREVSKRRKPTSTGGSITPWISKITHFAQLACEPTGTGDICIHTVTWSMTGQIHLAMKATYGAECKRSHSPIHVQPQVLLQHLIGMCQSPLCSLRLLQGIFELIRFSGIRLKLPATLCEVVHGAHQHLLGVL